MRVRRRRRIGPRTVAKMLNPYRISTAAESVYRGALSATEPSRNSGIGGRTIGFRSARITAILVVGSYNGDDTGANL